ncbi:MAG: translation initiation factor IF-3 C-terminal domain-containing protein, partial [Clostridia bacterium]|nr:translation initiation factor IF-3 C-terminal domain-containing protein [Clostridia bacterium]
KFLSGGNKVRANLRFKGREITHPEIGTEMLERFAEACSEVGTVEKKPKLEGRTMSIFIAPSKGE